MVEILRPARRHRGDDQAETLRFMRIGAPMAPFLAQVIAQNQDNRSSPNEAADRYEAACALSAPADKILVVTL